jgi:hypothetical protein
MRPSSILMFALAFATAAGQRSGGGASRGGMHTGPPTLTFGNPFTNPRTSTPLGAGPLSHWNGNHPSRGPFAPRSWLGPAVIVEPGYPLAYPPYSPDMANSYQGAPQFDPTTFPDATQLPPSAPEPGVTMNQSNGCSVSQSGGGTANEVSAASPAERFRMETVAIPERESANEYHPPLIALKNNWAYSASKYWTEGKTFHFVTTQGDHIRVPAGLVERIYPGSGQKKN